MDDFTNETIDTARLPKFEQVELTALDARYGKIVLLRWSLVSLVLLASGWSAAYLIPDFPIGVIATLLIVLALMGLVLLWSYASYRKKAFAFRTHDLLFKHGLIATSTIVIPYNRIQHVALHEGVLARIFGLATVEIFTAGASSSDIAIPGIDRDQAENIKQLLMTKIQKAL